MSDFSEYIAAQIRDWMSQNTQMDTPPNTLWITLFNDQDAEVDGDLENGRIPVATDGTDWTVTNTSFENAVEIDFGEATADIADVVDVALYDSDVGGNEIARYTLTDAPISFSERTRVFFDPQELSFDIVDRTQP